MVQDVYLCPGCGLGVLTVAGFTVILCTGNHSNKIPALQKRNSSVSMMRRDEDDDGDEDENEDVCIQFLK